MVNQPLHRNDVVTLFLCGDVMTGRAIDQILSHPGSPELHEPGLFSALDYLQMAEQVNGPIPRAANDAYIWGEALAELERMAPAVRIINLETSVSRSEKWLPKGINYRMHPDNVGCLTAAGVDCCALANNHVLDFGAPGLEETLATLQHAGLKVAGAGCNCDEAAAPAALALPGGGRVLVFAFGSESSGVSSDSAATAATPGVNRLGDLSERTVRAIAEQIVRARRPGDIVVASIHWGENFGYVIPPEQTRFARALIDEAGVAVVHGHSAHHVKGIEAYRDHLILYGCGDFLNDYEGIHGYEDYRGDLGLMYFVTVERASGRLLRLDMTPTRIRRFQVQRAAAGDARWLCDVLSRESTRFGVRVTQRDDYRLELRWDGGDADNHMNSGPWEATSLSKTPHDGFCHCPLGDRTLGDGVKHGFSDCANIFQQPVLAEHRRMIPNHNAPWRFAAACLLAGAAWMLVEVGGGLAFLAAGVRLWRYDIAPLWREITSPLVWVFAAALIVPLSVAFDRHVSYRLHGWRKAAARLAFLMIVGPLLEVLINENLFKALYGQPLYEYLVLPLFDGSSSLLSPLYYATLLIHVPITDRLLSLPSPRRPAVART